MTFVYSLFVITISSPSSSSSSSSYSSASSTHSSSSSSTEFGPECSPSWGKPRLIDCIVAVHKLSQRHPGDTLVIDVINIPHATYDEDNGYDARHGT